MALLVGLVAATGVLGVVTERALHKGGASSALPGTTTTRSSSRSCPRLADRVLSFGGSSRHYRILLHRLQSTCPNEARRRSLDARFLPPCHTAAQPDCTSYPIALWIARQIEGSLDLAFRRVDAKDGRQVIAGTGGSGPEQTYFATVRSIPIAPTSSYTLTAYWRKQGRGPGGGRMLVACFDRSNTYLGTGPLASLAALRPTRGVLTPAEDGTVRPRRAWLRFGGVLLPGACPPRTVAVRPQLVITFDGDSAATVLVDAIQLEQGSRASPFTLTRRNLLPDPSFEKGRIFR